MHFGITLAEVPTSRMKKATSMLEMNELHDVITFGEDMQALAQIDEEKALVALSGDEHDGDNDGFFLADLEETNDPGALALSTSPDRVAYDLDNNDDVQDEPKISSTLQRANSLACLQVSEKKSKFRLASSASSALAPMTPSESTERPQDRPRSGSQGSLRASCHSTGSFKSVDSSDRLTRSRSVSFSSIEIRSYARTMGDVPTTNGIPVQLDWKYDPDTEEYSVDDYESYREEEPRRDKSEMLMPASHRQYLLMREYGFTRGEIMAQMEIVKKAAKDRKKTRSTLKYMPYEEKLEKTRRMFGKLSRSTSLNNLSRSTSSTMLSRSTSSNNLSRSASTNSFR